MTNHSAKQDPTAARERPLDMFLVAIWFGLLVGLAEGIVWVIKKSYSPFTGLNWDVLWMAPVADVLIWAVPGALFFLTRCWTSFPSLMLVSFLFSFMGFLSVEFIYLKMHPLASVLLATGLAFQTARFIAARADRFPFFARRSLRWMMISVIGLLGMAQGWQWLNQPQAIAEAAPPVGAPNVLLIVLDTVRAQSLSAYGYSQPTTPHLERLAQIGIRFEQAMATAPWTLPSHASMFTGRFPHELSADWFAPLDGTHPTLAEVLRAHGYRTAGFVGNLFYCNHETGLGRGFDYYEDYKVSPGEILRNSLLVRRNLTSPPLRQFLGYYNELGRRDAVDINRSFLQWLDDQRQRPFFAFLNYFDAHEPYLPPPPYDLSGPQTTEEKLIIYRWPAEDKPNLAPQQIEMARRAYESCITHLDQQLGLLFKALEDRGQLDNTLIIVTSDHGEQFGEHGLFGHGSSLYRPVLNVPLLISLPKRLPTGLSIRQPVSLRDLPATVLDLIKLDETTEFPGGSLARYWNGTGEAANPDADWFVAEVSGAPPNQPNQGLCPAAKGPVSSLVMDGKQYIMNQGEAREELYDLENDPLEQHDLARREEERQTLERFRTMLQKVLANDPTRVWTMPYNVSTTARDNKK